MVAFVPLHSSETLALLAEVQRGQIVLRSDKGHAHVGSVVDQDVRVRVWVKNDQHGVGLTVHSRNGFSDDPDRRPVDERCHDSDFALRVTA